MKRSMLITLCSILLFSSCVIREFISPLPFPARAAQMELPFMDRSISGISMGFPQTSIEVLGEKLLAHSRANQPLVITNKKQTEYLELYFKDLNRKFAVSEFHLKSKFNNSNAFKIQAVDNFKTYKGIRLGISLKELLAKLGKSESIKKNGDQTIVKYHLTGKEKSSFLITMNMPIYNAEYIFEKEKLINAKWGVSR